MSLIICPVGQRLWRPVLLVASFVRGTQPGWSSPGPSITSLLKKLRFLKLASVPPFLCMRPTEEYVVAARGFGSHVSSPLWLLVSPGYTDVRRYVGAHGRALKSVRCV